MVESHESKEDAKRTLCFIEGVVARGWQITRWIASSPVFRSADFRVPSDPPLHVCMQFDNVCFYVMCSFDQKHNTHYRWGDLPDDAAARPLVVYGPRERWIVVRAHRPRRATRTRPAHHRTNTHTRARAAGRRDVGHGRRGAPDGRGPDRDVEMQQPSDPPAARLVVNTRRANALARAHGPPRQRPSALEVPPCTGHPTFASRGACARSRTLRPRAGMAHDCAEQPTQRPAAAAAAAAAVGGRAGQPGFTCTRVRACVWVRTPRARRTEPSPATPAAPRGAS